MKWLKQRISTHVWESIDKVAMSGVEDNCESLMKLFKNLNVV